MATIFKRRHPDSIKFRTHRPASLRPHVVLESDRLRSEFATFRFNTVAIDWGQSIFQFQGDDKQHSISSASSSKSSQSRICEMAIIPSRYQSLQRDVILASRPDHRHYLRTSRNTRDTLKELSIAINIAHRHPAIFSGVSCDSKTIIPMPDVSESSHTSLLTIFRTINRRATTSQETLVIVGPRTTVITGS